MVLIHNWPCLPSQRALKQAGPSSTFSSVLELEIVLSRSLAGPEPTRYSIRCDHEEEEREERTSRGFDFIQSSDGLDSCSGRTLDCPHEPVYVPMPRLIIFLAHSCTIRLDPGNGMRIGQLCVECVCLGHFEWQVVCMNRCGRSTIGRGLGSGGRWQPRCIVHFTEPEERKYQLCVGRYTQ